MSRPKLLFVKRWKWISPDKCIFCVYTTYTHEWKMESLTPRKRKSIRPCQQIRESTSREEIADLSRDKKLRHVRIGIGRGGGGASPLCYSGSELQGKGRKGQDNTGRSEEQNKTENTWKIHPTNMVIHHPRYTSRRPNCTGYVPRRLLPWYHTDWYIWCMSRMSFVYEYVGCGIKKQWTLRTETTAVCVMCSWE